MVDRAAVVILGALLALLSLPANAGYALAKPPSGWVKSQDGIQMFKAPHTFPGNDGYFRTTATVNVGGRIVDVPAGLKVAANAASFAVPFIRSTPGGLIGTAVIQWLMMNGLSWDDAYQQWVKEQIVAPDGATRFEVLAQTTGQTNYMGRYAGSCSASQPGDVTIQWSDASFTVYVRSAQPAPSGWGQFTCSGSYGGYTHNRTFSRAGCPSGAVLDIAIGSCGVSEVRPATEQDWQSITGELPIAVAQELAVRMPLPVQLPEMLPQRVVLDSPVPVPATNPQQYRQQIVDIKPLPSLAEPWRVELKPGEVVTTDPVGLPDTAPLDEQSPAADPSDAKLDPQSLCDLYPDVLACQKLGSLEAEPLPEKTVPMSIEPTTGWGEGGGSCPADRSVTVLGRQMSMRWSLFCDFADQVRPIVIAMAWLSAVLGFVGLSRREA